MKNIVLTEYQKKIINAEICPYCKSETKIVDETFIYGKDYRGRKVFCCIKLSFIYLIVINYLNVYLCWY